MSEKILPQHLARKAILYVRQSSAWQVANNLESQRLQYAMEAHLRQLASSGGTRKRPFSGTLPIANNRNFECDAGRVDISPHNLLGALPVTLRKRSACPPRPGHDVLRRGN
ncbi:hypothetical protein AB3X96_39120 [Paraburkholderia sp. BR13439]|uniref:hypothetical protein n=1 Tax=Paraburkholderia sp. BR13439 TaxID=3236996 RepID=UPI0034CD4A9E